jgi:hypothetical protein
MFIRLNYIDVTEDTERKVDNGERDFKEWDLIYIYWLPNIY